jgi:hypothetical protein
MNKFTMTKAVRLTLEDEIKQRIRAERLSGGEFSKRSPTIQISLRIRNITLPLPNEKSTRLVLLSSKTSSRARK